MNKTKTRKRRFLSAGLCGILTLTSASAVQAAEQSQAQPSTFTTSDQNMDQASTFAASDQNIDQTSTATTSNQNMAQLADILIGASDENLVISPFSIRMALSMLAEGAGGQSLAELEQFLVSYAEMPEENAALNLQCANSFWLNQDFHPAQDYVDLLRSKYDALAQTLDFADPSAPDTINQWVRDNTNGLLDNMVDGSIAGMEAVLMNALYYNGTWQMPFDDESIIEKPFHAPAGDQDASMLTGSGSGWDYLENDQASGFRLSYLDGLQFIAILPNEEDFQIADLDLDGFLASTDDWCTQNIELYYELPEFKAAYTTSLENALCQLGVSQIFTEEADLSGIADQLTVSSILHKTFIDVNRNGTEATSATSIMLKAASLNPADEEAPIYKEVILDRPFLFLIQEPISGEILFMGRIADVAAVSA